MGAAAVGVLTASCAGDAAVPAAAEVAALLGDAHDARATPDELCDLATTDLSCRSSLGTAPRAPEVAPTLTCTGPFDAPEGYVDGTLARVQGVDGDGNAYDSTLLAIMTHEGARFIDPVYWAAAGISTGSTTDESNHVELDC
ncbi:hypothetical protein [Georgenia satyanarayanai]|uniref:hypothetical protein n=1 Tax=Georgenia satyanarayanai TaxID=860221 RepID=UPI0011B6BCD8|nr:hypothetical protein [Georgenia satyanarayanai]